jgi:hypothetical protein
MLSNVELCSSGMVREGSRGSKAETPLFRAVMIDKGKAPPVRSQLRRQRMIGHAGAADERHDRAYVDKIFGLDAQQMEPQAVRRFAYEGYAGKAQEAGWIGRTRKPFEKGRFDKIDVDHS